MTDFLRGVHALVKSSNNLKPPTFANSFVQGQSLLKNFVRDKPLLFAFRWHHRVHSTIVLFAKQAQCGTHYVIYIFWQPATARVGIYATYISSCTFMYLCVLCYCDACLKSGPLRVGMKILRNTHISTGSLIPILVLFTCKMQAWTFWYILLLCEPPLFDIILDNWLKTE